MLDGEQSMSWGSATSQDVVGRDQYIAVGACGWSLGLGCTAGNYRGIVRLFRLLADPLAVIVLVEPA